MYKTLIEKFGIQSKHLFNFNEIEYYIKNDFEYNLL